MARWTDTAEGYWEWRDGLKIRYQRSGETGPALLLVHGFGGNADHWRKNTAELARSGFRVFAVDLLGYGYSSQPDPRAAEVNSIYNFENWGEQLVDFMDQVIGSGASIVCNSVGGLAGLDAAIRAPERVPFVMCINISLRGLNERRQNPVLRPLVTAFQTFLRESSAGPAFFGTVARPDTVRKVLTQAYGDPAAVTDELVDCILQPGLRESSAPVFLDFISYSGGPLPEDQLEVVQRPVVLVWGDRDPWESIDLGRRLLGPERFDSVQAFVPLPGVGHCPQDEAPGLVNPLIVEWANKYAAAAPAE